MHYYQHHIGDFIKATARLSDGQTMAYLRLLWMYYDSEKPLKPDNKILAFQIGASEQDVDLILNSYFILCENGWHQKRCDLEIAEYRALLDKKSAAGKASAEHRKNKRSTVVQHPLHTDATDVQLTSNHKPITNNHNKATVVATPEGVSDSVWQDFKTLRKAKKAPITERALEGLRSEAQKAGWSLEQALSECCVRGWQAFKADWVSKSLTAHGYKPDIAHITTPTPANHDAALRKIEEDRKKAAKPSAEVQAKIAELLKGRVA